MAHWNHARCLYGDHHTGRCLTREEWRVLNEVKRILKPRKGRSRGTP